MILRLFAVFATILLAVFAAQEAAALKPYIGKHIALKANELSCATAAGQLSDAIVSKWSVVTTH